MKKLICILAGAALFGACEQKTEVVNPASATPANTPTEAMGQKPKRNSASLSTSQSSSEAAVKTDTEVKVESVDAATPTP